MDEESREQYREEYQEAKKKGIPFWPDALFKDAVVSLIVFVVLILLSAFIGAELGERADPSDSSFTPTPEWYFLYLFQLLKYFPGNLEFVGVIVIPSVVLILIIALPWLDRSPKRHILARPFVLAGTLFVVIAIGVLSFIAVSENPPPAEALEGDPVAMLYVENCAGCHSASIVVPAGVSLSDVIAEGGHAGMPAWSGDLTNDEIDALAGFILSPNGNDVFRRNCSDCHDAEALGNINPLTLRAALDAPDFEAHAGLEIDVPTGDAASALVNFLIAPDGHRLFAENCSACHGNAVAFAGTEEDLRHIIELGGGHQQMPAMSGVLSDGEIAVLASYVVDPVATDPAAAALYEAHCTFCHGAQVPAAADREEATLIIAEGGSHETMPVWGQILTVEQIDALTAYAFDAAQGSPAIAGQPLYADNCADCHGDFGEGGLNPANPDLVIPPISTGQYLATRDDTTIRAIINQGQPDSGMSPFGLSFGGPLDEEEIGAIVAFIRAWQADPPVEIPPVFERPEPEVPDLSVPASVTYAQFCAQCHGATAEGGLGPSFIGEERHATTTDGQLYRAIEQGHDGTAMIAWGGILTDQQLSEMVEYIRGFASGSVPDDAPDEVLVISFQEDVFPLFRAYCVACHGSLGGWSAETYDDVVSTGDNAPVVIPGDPEASILVQRLYEIGGPLMPPGRMLRPHEIEVIETWIRQGPLDN